MDLLELVGYFFGFWLFIFSKKFRELIISDWNSAGIIGRFFITLGAFSSFLCGVIGPGWLLYYLAVN